jgi:hypothetical protein
VKIMIGGFDGGTRLCVIPSNVTAVMVAVTQGGPVLGLGAVADDLDLADGTSGVIMWDVKKGAWDSGNNGNTYMSGHDHFGHRHGFWCIIECRYYVYHGHNDVLKNCSWALTWRYESRTTSMFLPWHFWWLTPLLLLLLLLHGTHDTHSDAKTGIVLFIDGEGNR